MFLSISCYSTSLTRNFEHPLNTSLSLCYNTLALAKFFKNDPISEVKATFTKLDECIETSFIMAYDKDSELFLGNKADDVRVSMTYAIKGIHAALAGCNFETARQIADI